MRIRDGKSGSEMSNPDYISESLETLFWVKMLKYFDVDPGWKKFGFGIRNTAYAYVGHSLA